MANTRDPILHPIPILSLHPTQMTVGMREVKEKRKRWREHASKKKQGELLGKHTIPVVLGPDQRHYVIDHHHLAIGSVLQIDYLRPAIAGQAKIGPSIAFIARTFGR